jgi:hypothetical protein
VRDASPLVRQGPRLSLWHVSYAGVGPRGDGFPALATEGYFNERGKPYAAKSVASMLA